MSGELRVERFASIHEIPESVWDGLLAEDWPYNTHRLIRAVEDARVESSRFWYLLFYDGDRPIASAVLSAFTVSLGIFLSKRLERFLGIDVLFCGLPASFGQSNVVLTDGVLPLLVREMESIARETGLRFLCIKEFTQSEVPSLEPFGFFRGYSIPYMSMQIRWSSFDDYLRSLRHSYRRHIRRSMAKLAPARVVIGGPEVVSPARFHQLYRNVMARAETKLEVFNEAFFERLWAELDLQIVAVVDGDAVLGAALLVKTGSTLHFMLVGLPEAQRTPHDIYFNLLYAIVDQAIRQRCTRLNLGQTAYWGKQQIGGVPEDEFLFFKAQNRILHAILRALRRILFPRLRLPSPRVFR